MRMHAGNQKGKREGKRTEHQNKRDWIIYTIAFITVMVKLNRENELTSQTGTHKQKAFVMDT